jgi:hypothetical protein
MFRNRTRRFWVTLIVVVAAAVFYLPSLVAFRYTAAPQNTSFFTHPWRSWSFAFTALTVPGDAKLKTSGEALRKAEVVWKQSAVNPDSVRVMFVSGGEPLTFTHEVAGSEVTTTVTPPYDLVWQVRGDITSPDGKVSENEIVGLLDYRSGKVLYDVRKDLPQSPPATVSPSPAASPSASPSDSSSPGGT